ncbi:MAG: hypothetical protein M0Q24_04435 [Sulfurimonas sp.]|uniref:hypothetical protein n=1 Tax=Sulfurimonas sp. TaxID=2022749 RepID=UPI0025CD6831|nr:hypothetical protein [Sulfurimonas sp.]MCK9491315.1 hypothetical protein [Sulfurimonas sp.]
MQVNIQNIQRSTLFSDFFGLELIWSNEYLTYIQTTVNNVTSSLCKTAKSTTHNIKKSLNRANIQILAMKVSIKNMIRFIKNLNKRVNSHKEVTK